MAVVQERLTTERVRLLIDTDAGTDDAQAMLAALRTQTATIEAITTVHGNCAEAQVCSNVLKMLRAAGRSVPVYRGAAFPLMSPGKAGPNALSWHGRDGFGEATLPDVDISQIPTGVDKSAAVVIARMAQLHPGELTLVALGPLTNIALALQLEPALPRLLKRVVFMGGDRHGNGNITP
jgi:purine nucleosidase